MIYLDNAATTAVSSSVADVINDALTEADPKLVEALL